MVLFSFPKYGCLFLSYDILHHMINTWVLPSKSHSVGRCSKLTHWRELRKLVPIHFPKYGWFSSIKFRSYGLQHHKGNAWVFPSISHILEKVTKPILYKNPAKMVPLVFLEYTCFCCSRFLPYGMLYHMENTWVFSSITWENAANPLIGENLEK